MERPQHQAGRPPWVTVLGRRDGTEAIVHSLKVSVRPEGKGFVICSTVSTTRQGWEVELGGGE